jgi:hypothetical protein
MCFFPVVILPLQPNRRSAALHPQQLAQENHLLAGTAQLLSTLHVTIKVTEPVSGSNAGNQSLAYKLLQQWMSGTATQGVCAGMTATCMATLEVTGQLPDEAGASHGCVVGYCRFAAARTLPVEFFNFKQCMRCSTACLSAACSSPSRRNNAMRAKCMAVHICFFTMGPGATGGQHS